MHDLARATVAGMWRPGSTYMDQQAVFQPITKWTVRAESLATFPDIISRALKVATTGNPGPVAVIVSNPLWAAEGDFQLPTEAETVHHPAFRVAPGAESVAQAAQLLRDAKRPAIIAGGGVILSQAAQDLIELAELQNRMIRARSVAGVGIATGHDALEQVVVSLQGLIHARGGMAQCHAALRRAKEQIPGLRTTSFGDGQQCPPAAALPGLRAVA